MGNIYVREVFGVKSPRIALLNNGEEEKKGNALTSATYQVLKASELNFVGNIEGQNLSKGLADVVVTDGFTGNVVLKTLEGVGEAFLKLKNNSQAPNATDSMQLDVGFGSLVKRIDYRESGGACLLGLNGNVIISHGRSQAKAIRNAIGMAKQSIDRNVCQIIQQSKFVEPVTPGSETENELKP
jgi:glycerol-3-phosphate acyltransferase PlsX